jgi:ribA/ribD-fused uncharacterized protein
MTRTDLPTDLESLLTAVRRGEHFKYLFFWGHQPSADGRLGASVFSQWWPAPFTVEGEQYRSAEHYMMAEKARLFADANTRARILAASTPAEAKKLGRAVQHFDEQVWQNERFAIVVRGSIAKFASDPQLREYLISTSGKVLVEASPLDKIWGIGMGKDHAHAENPLEWRGLNLLGFALMVARAALT